MQVGADRHLLADHAVQRLQLGLLWWALLAVVLHLVHLLFVKSLTVWGLLIGGWAGGRASVLGAATVAGWGVMEAAGLPPACHGCLIAARSQ
jgi:hypothetical protein